MCALIINDRHIPSIMALRGFEVTHCESQHSHMESSPVRAFHLSWQMHKYAQSAWKQQGGKESPIVLDWKLMEAHLFPL